MVVEVVRGVVVGVNVVEVVDVLVMWVGFVVVVVGLSFCGDL